MAKKDILPQIRDNFKVDSLVNRPQNVGKLTKEEVEALNAKLFTYKYGSCESGLALKFYCAISSENRVVDCKIEVFGESELVAVASIAGLIVKNKKPEEILNLKEKGLEYFLRENPNTPAFPKSFRFLTNVMMDALYQLANAISGNPKDDGAVVDNYTKTPMRFIKETIKNFNVKDIKDLSELTRAGLYDKSVLYAGAGESLSNYYLVDILRDTLKEMEEEAKRGSALPSNKSFKEMDVEEKRVAIDAIIDKHIRHMLIMDGGDMEILDIKENGDNTDIYIRYLGACNGCASASTGTLFAIEGILKQKLDPDIRVIPL